MKFEVRNVFDTDVETYWNEIFFSEEYNARMYSEALGFSSFELLELTGEKGGDRRRRFRTEPAADAPAVVRKVVGDRLSYTETGEWRASTGIWTYAIETSQASDRVQIGGRLWAEPTEDGRCMRVAEINVSVKIFGVGTVIEKFIERTTRDSYVKASAFTNRFIAEKGLGK